MVCFFYEKKEFKEEIKQLREDAQFLAMRNNLRMAIVTDEPLIKSLKKKYLSKMFPQIGYTGCALRRYDGHFEVLDLTSDTETVSFAKWINRNTLRPVQELTLETAEV